MFNRFTSLLVLVAPLASALTLDTPTNPSNGDRVTLTWKAAAGDPTFSLELENPTFNNELAIANNLDPVDGSYVWQVPVVPARNDYVINAVNIGNLSEVYASTSVFAIGALSSTTTTSTGTGTSTTGTSITIGSTTGNTLPVTSTGVTTPTSVGTGTGTLNTGTANTGTGTGTSASTSASTLPTSAAVSSRLALSNAFGYALLLLSVVGGTVAVAL